MTKAFDKTLQAIAELEDAVALIETEIKISDLQKVSDLQRIIVLLDKASSLIIDAVAIYQRYEKFR